MLPGSLFDMPFEFSQDLVERFYHLQVDLNAFPHLGILKAFRDAGVVVFARKFLVESWQVVLGVGILDMGDEFTAPPCNIHPSSQQITGGPPFRRIGIGDGEIAALEQTGDFIGIDFIVLGLAAMDCPHIQGVAEDEGELLGGAEIGQPIPAEDTFHPDNDIFLIGRNEFEKQPRIGVDVLVKLDFSLLIDNADIHFPGMKIDSAIILVLLGIEIHRFGLLWLKVGCCVNLHYLPSAGRRP